MTFEGSSPSAAPVGSASASSSLLPPVNDTRRRSPRSDAEKLDMVCNYMRNELRWGVADFVKVLASAGGSNNTRQKAAFAAAAFKDSEVLKSYVGDAGQLQDGGRIRLCPGIQRRQWCSHVQRADRATLRRVASLLLVSGRASTQALKLCLEIHRLLPLNSGERHLWCYSPMSLMSDRRS